MYGLKWRFKLMSQQGFVKVEKKGNRAYSLKIEALGSITGCHAHSKFLFIVLIHEERITIYLFCRVA